MTTVTANTTQAMTAHWELIRLNHAFAFYLDNGDFESMIELFTTDGLFDRAGIVHRGHDELREGMSDRPKVTPRHLLANFHLTSLGDDTAEAVVCAMVYHGPVAENGQAVVYATDNGRVIEFYDRYVRSVDGWRIASRIARPIFTPKVWP
ncbi:MAG: nuclear transport factor 2 family protein [Mycobacterium sp.]